MRNRFFFIILAALILAAVGINWVHVHFFESQRRKLIDRQISEASATLLASDDFLGSVSTPAAVEEMPYITPCTATRSPELDRPLPKEPRSVTVPLLGLIRLTVPALSEASSVPSASSSKRTR